MPPPTGGFFCLSDTQPVDSLLHMGCNGFRPLTNRSPAMRKLCLILRRAVAWTKLFCADVTVDALVEELAIDDHAPGSRAYLPRKLVVARGKRALARAEYQATFAPGDRLTWIDA